MSIYRLEILALLALLPLVEQVYAAGTSPTFTTTNNWGGYAVTGGNLSVTNVTGSWRVPKSECGGTAGSDTAIFVGIDGYPPSDPNVEQVGTAAYCTAAGKIAYYAFYEFVCAGCPPPSPPGQYPVKPGDTISAAVSCNGGTEFTVQLMDGTTTLFTANQPAGFSAACSSAEWVVDDPAEGLNLPLFPLTSFEQAEFGVGFCDDRGANGVDWVIR
jgi:Peptidase A4 family